MWPLLALLGAGFLLKGSDTTSAPGAPGASGLGLGAGSAAPGAAAGSWGPFAAELALALTRLPAALVELATALARLAPQDLAGLSPTVARLASAVAAQPALAPQLAQELANNQAVRAELAAAIQAHGPLAALATVAVMRAQGLAPGDVRPGAVPSVSVPQVQATPPPWWGQTPPASSPPAPPAPASPPVIPTDRAAQGRRALELLATVSAGGQSAELAALQAALGTTPADGMYSTQSEHEARAATYGRTLRGTLLGAKSRAGLRVLTILDSDPAYRSAGRSHPEFATLADALQVPGNSSRDGTYSPALESLARQAVLNDP